MQPLPPSSPTGFALHRGEAAVGALRGALDGADPDSPFLTSAWVDAWWAAYGCDRPLAATLGPDVRAVAWLQAGRGGGIVAPANPHTGDWDVVARDAPARAALWHGLAHAGARWARLGPLRVGSPSLDIAEAAFREAGYRVVVESGARSPYLALPATFDDLMAAASSNHRSQIGRRRRALERVGSLRLRVTTAGGPQLDRDLAEVFRVEASGWKARAGTAILAEPQAERLYRAFAREAAERGILRLYLLELDGRAIAADLGCATGGVGHLLKTGFDEKWQRFSPGVILRADVLRASIEEGLRGYDFLGPDDAYKLRWTGTVRPRATLHAFRGAAAVPGLAWRSRLRPALKRRRVDALLRRDRGGRAPRG